jgi:DNA invertase Pin-like site-specific DNA recombinase
LQRPALQSLLADIRPRKIDIVVDYKVDRLTRSLDLAVEPRGDRKVGSGLSWA